MNQPNQNNTDILDVLTREGVLINVSVRYPRFHKKLKPVDLGLDPDQISDRLMSLGHKRLLPKEALANLALCESRAHAIIDQSTFPFLGGIGHFLTNTKLADVRERLFSQKDRFETACFSFLAEYARHRDDALNEWRTLAGQICKTTEERERLVLQISQSFPPRNLLERRFSFEIRLFQIAVPEHMTIEVLSFADQAEVMRARREAAQSAAADIREGVEGFVSECVTTLRQETAKLCDDMLASMREGKTSGVHQKTLNRLRDFIDRFQALNFANDDEMAAMLGNARQQLLGMTADEYRDNPTATRSLQDGLSELRDHAHTLATQDARELVERFGQMGRRKLQLAS
ncbi:MAG: hypothetical protein ACI8UO_006176 [Verrucomicrobiales bacterium]|jgi:hypothetical protein